MNNRKIEIDLDDYIEMLERRKREVADNFGWTIPDGVWDHFLEILEDCGSVGENSSPSYIVDNIAVNGDYGPIENYSLLDEMIQNAIEEAACEGITLDEDTVKELLLELSYDDLCEKAEEQDDGSASFFYEDPDSDYGLGVCFSL